MSQQSPAYLIDTHAHVNFKEFDYDRQAVFARAKTAGVGKIILVGTDIETNRDVARLTWENEEVFATVGYHPIYVTDLPDEKRDEIYNQLREQTKSECVVAIGEIGLDYFHNKENREAQIVWFRMMLDLAKETKLPVIIHCRDAFADLLEILAEYRGKILGAVHCFTAGIEEADRLIEMGFLIGLTGLITYTKDEKLLEAVRTVNLQKILVETDCPYLAPKSVRGERNEPAYVREVAQKIAEMKEADFEKVVQITTRNAEQLFKI